MSAKTIERHLSTIYRKLDVRNRAEASAWLIRNIRQAMCEGKPSFISEPCQQVEGSSRCAPNLCAFIVQFGRRNMNSESIHKAWRAAAILCSTVHCCRDHGHACEAKVSDEKPKTVRVDLVL